MKSCLCTFDNFSFQLALRAACMVDGCVIWLHFSPSIQPWPPTSQHFLHSQCCKYQMIEKDSDTGVHWVPQTLVTSTSGCAALTTNIIYNPHGIGIVNNCNIVTLTWCSEAQTVRIDALRRWLTSKISSLEVVADAFFVDLLLVKCKVLQPFLQPLPLAANTRCIWLHQATTAANNSDTIHWNHTMSKHS